jgi:hypothetical protein
MFFRSKKKAERWLKNRSHFGFLVTYWEFMMPLLFLTSFLLVYKNLRPFVLGTLALIIVSFKVFDFWNINKNQKILKKH